MNKTTIATAVAAALGASAGLLPSSASAVGLADGFYDMTINNTPFSGGYVAGNDGAWNSSFTFGALPSTSNSQFLYDDTVATPINGKYGGNPNDGVTGTIGLKVQGGVITGTGTFEFDMIPATAGGDFVEYGGSSGFTGSIDGAGNISLQTTGALGAVGGFASLVDERWNVDNFNGVTGTVPNNPNNNTAYDAFSTGSATNTTGSINGAVWDGTSAVLVKGGRCGSDWGGFFGCNYFEAWNVGFTKTGDIPPIPVPAAVWLFGSGLVGLVGVARRRKSKA